MPAFQVTLTNANTNYELLALVRAIDANFVDHGSQIILQADNGNTEAILFARDSNLSTTRYGFRLAANEGMVFDRGQGEFHLKNIYARSASSGQKVNIDITR